MSIKDFFFGIIKYTLLFVSLMLVGALSTFITLQLFTSSGQVVAPDLKGKDPVEAIQILTKEGLSLKILPQKRYDSKIPAERILSQSPLAGTKIKQGRSIEVYISLGPEKVIVPDLIGQTARAATITLEQYQLQQGKVIYVSMPGAEPDQILAQFPLSGTEVTDVRTVNLLANTGVYGSREAYVMPDLIGRPVDQATQFFRSAGLRVGSSQPIDYPGIESGTVVKQSPPAGYKVGRDTAISLYYSK